MRAEECDQDTVGELPEELKTILLNNRGKLQSSDRGSSVINIDITYFIIGPSAVITRFVHQRRQSQKKKKKKKKKRRSSLLGKRKSREPQRRMM